MPLTAICVEINKEVVGVAGVQINKDYQKGIYSQLPISLLPNDPNSYTYICKFCKKPMTLRKISDCMFQFTHNNFSPDDCLYYIKGDSW